MSSTSRTASCATDRSSTACRDRGATTRARGRPVAPNSSVSASRSGSARCAVMSGPDKIGGECSAISVMRECRLIQAPINQRDAPICTATALPPCSAVFCSHGASRFGRVELFGENRDGANTGKVRLRRSRGCESCATRTCREPCRRRRSFPESRSALNHRKVRSLRREYPTVLCRWGAEPRSIRYCLSAVLASSAEGTGLRCCLRAW